MSKAPLNDGSTVMLESDGNEQRVYQRNVVELNGHRVAFYNTHLSYENTELRHQQMNTLKAAMDLLTSGFLPAAILNEPILTLSSSFVINVS